tara:strand:- start:52 stop:366 length:315 start_codon:yes stop_codon:yes gene_type:complete
MNRSKITIFLTIVLLFSGCGVVKEGFKSPKQRTSDEFLVEKKSPLVMPPNFNELPVPNSSNEIIQKDQKTIKSLITKSEENKNNIKKKNNQNLEKTILEKIKSN